MGILTTIPAASAATRSYIQPRPCASRKWLASAPMGRSTSAGVTASSGSTLDAAQNGPAVVESTSTKAAHWIGSRRARPGRGATAAGTVRSFGGGTRAWSGGVGVVGGLSAGRLAQAT